MSASHIALVFAHSRAKGVARLVALALANGYDVEADHAVISMDVLEREAAATPAQVDRAIRELARLGEWSTTARPDGVRVLRMRLSCPLNCDGTAAHETTWQVMSA